MTKGQRKGRSEHGKDKRMFSFPEVGVPLFWPIQFLVGYEEETLETLRKNLEFLEEIEKTQIEKPRPMWTTKNSVRIDLHTLRLRDFSTGKDGVPTLVVAPYAGHTSVIVDFHTKQSLVETLMENGLEQVCVTDWKSATMSMKDYDVDNYLGELDICVDELGGLVNLAGMCQGGWLSTMYSARFPNKVNTLVLGGSPIDTDAGDGTIKEYAHTYPVEFFEELVSMGDGLLRGDFMLMGFKSLHPEEQYMEKFVDLYEHLDDPSYLKRFERFEKWYEYTIALPGRWYLQVIKELFKENRLYKGKFVGLGKKLSLHDIECPAYLLAGDKDDITPKEQVFNAARHLGTKKSEIVKDTAPGGHIGLFMGSRPLRQNWPRIAKWINVHSGG